MPNNERATVADAQAMIGKTWIEHTDYFDLATGRTHPAPDKTYKIIDAEPADDFYYQTCPDAGRRVKCTLVRVLADGTVRPPRRVKNYRWLQPQQGWLEPDDVS